VLAKKIKPCFGQSDCYFVCDKTVHLQLYL